jgi:hypothetical protein
MPRPFAFGDAHRFAPDRLANDHPWQGAHASRSLAAGAFRDLLRPPGSLLLQGRLVR